MIFKKKHIVTSKERKKNGIYILYTQHVFPTFSSFSPTARVIRFPLPPSLPPSPPPLSVYSEAPEGAKRESSQTSQSAVAAIIGKVNSAAIDAIARETPPFHSSFLFYAVCIFWKGEREKKNAFHRGALMPPLRGGACTSDSNFAGTHSHSRLLIPRDFVDGRGPYS